MRIDDLAQGNEQRQRVLRAIRRVAAHVESIPCPAADSVLAMTCADIRTMIGDAVRDAIGQGRAGLRPAKRGKETIEVTAMDRAAAVSAARNLVRDRARRLGMIVRENGGTDGKR